MGGSEGGDGPPYRADLLGPDSARLANAGCGALVDWTVHLLSAIAVSSRPECQDDIEAVAHRAGDRAAIRMDRSPLHLLRDRIEASGREHAMRSSESDDRRASDRFAEMNAVAKLGVRYVTRVRKAPSSCDVGVAQSRVT